MKVLMYGLACDKRQYEKYITINSSPFVVAHYIFEKTLIEDLSDKMQIDHNYILQQKSNFRSDVYVHKRKMKISKNVYTTYLNYINLPGIKFLSLFLITFFRNIRWCLINKKDIDQCFILSTINYFPVALANLITAKLFHIKNIIILTDCSNGYAYMNNREKSKIKLNLIYLKNIYRNIIHYFEKNYDAYIFFSEGMNEHINEKNKPWIVMEGMFTEDGISSDYFNYDIDTVKRDKAIIYAGTLQPHLGIDMFVEAFKKIQDEDAKLWIFGDGDYRSYIEEQCKIDNRIQYFGFVSRNEVLEHEKKAKIVINTRNPSDPYTWMSFPSKTFEYMVSGTPFLTTKIKSIPKEYYDYIYLTDYNVNQISDKMKEILNKDIDELNLFGKKARDFILKNKNHTIQSKKVSDFLFELLREKD